MAAVEIKDTNISVAGRSDRQMAIYKLAEAMHALALALKEPDGAQYGVYIGNVAEPEPSPTENKSANSRRE